MTAGTSRTAQRAKVRAQSKIWLFGLALVAATGMQIPNAVAHTKHGHAAATHLTPHLANHLATRKTSHHYAANGTHHTAHYAAAGHRGKLRVAHYEFHRHTRYAAAHYRHSTLQCVPYAREVSHIELSGDAFLWWAEASGRYARGTNPEQGSVLNFRAIGRMPLGHVAVVTSVIDSRTIMVTQANWVRGTITNDVTIEDVSDDNDWSQVQVELGDGAVMGAPYPTYGFIYNRPDTLAGTTTIAATTTAQSTELAEAPRIQPVTNDAPNRNLQ